MDGRETAETIEATAVRWVARLDRDPRPPGVEAELDAWLAGDTRRRGALLRAQAAWELAAAPEASEIERPERVSRRRALGWGGALSVVAAGALGWLSLDRGATLATAKGEQRVTRLADGSTIHLNSSTRSQVRMLEDRRAVALDSGEAWFKVAKDKARPFVVAAGDVRVEAVGTAFAVRRLQGRAEVNVTEGRVRVWSTRQPARFIILDAGHRATVREAAAPSRSDVRIGGVADALAWRRGEIVLNDLTLGQAAAEFNRYNQVQLSIDASLADERLVGRFRTEEVVSFAESVAAMTGAQIERRDEMILVVR